MEGEKCVYVYYILNMEKGENNNMYSYVMYRPEKNTGKMN